MYNHSCAYIIQTSYNWKSGKQHSFRPDPPGASVVHLVVHVYTYSLGYAAYAYTVLLLKSAILAFTRQVLMIILLLPCSTQVGDPVLLRLADGGLGFFSLPAALNTLHCHDSNPISERLFVTYICIISYFIKYQYIFGHTKLLCGAL